MKNFVKVVIGIMYSSVAFSATKGDANMTAGVSSDNGNIYKGLTADYKVESEGAFQTFNSSIDLEYSSAKNRPSVINGHQYLYSNTIFNSNTYHLLKLPTPFIVVESGIAYKQTGEVDLDGNKQFGWSAYVGPTFKRKIRSDIDLKIGISIGQQVINKTETRDQNSFVSLKKYFSHTASLLLAYQNECVDFEDKSKKEACNRLQQLTYMNKTSKTAYMITLGQSTSESDVENVYQVQYQYKTNLTDSILIKSGLEKITPRVALALLDDASSLTDVSTLETQSLVYDKKLTRFSMSVSAERKKYPLLKEELEYQLSAGYLLGINHCYSCSVIYEYQKNVKPVSNWASWMVGVTYPIKRHWNTLFSIRETTQEVGEKFHSLNFQLTYDGSAKILSR